MASGQSMPLAICSFFINTGHTVDPLQKGRLDATADPGHVTMQRGQPRALQPVEHDELSINLCNNLDTTIVDGKASGPLPGEPTALPQRYSSMGGLGAG